MFNTVNSFVNCVTQKKRWSPVLGAFVFLLLKGPKSSLGI